MKKLVPLITMICLQWSNQQTLAQDTIVKRNKELLIGKVQLISGTEIQYKRFEMPDGPVFSVPRNDVEKISYQNGFQDVFARPEVAVKKDTVVKQEEAPDLTTHYVITLADGTQLRGVIVSETETELVFKDNNIGVKTLKKEQIKNRALQFGDQVRVFTMNDGSILTGKIVNQTPYAVIIETEQLGVVVIPNSKLKSTHDLESATITTNGKIWFQNPNCTRYLFAPSGIPLKKGEGYYQNIYGAGSAVNYGLTDNITIGGGMLGVFGVYINTKVGFDIGKNLHVAGGALLGNSLIPLQDDNFGLGIGFAVVTFGNYDHNITLGSGYGFINSHGYTKPTEKPLFVANGMARLGKKYALVTENWMVNVQGDPFNRGIVEKSHYETIFSYAFRYMGQKSTLDAGFLNTPALIENGWYIGIPYIGFVIRFGNYKD